MNQEFNPHITASRLIDTAKDIVSDMSSLTTSELAELLLEAAEVIYQQSTQHYNLLPEIIITVNGESFPINPVLSEHIVNKAAADWVVSVVRDYVVD
jgi:hypothetical protein